MSEPTSFARDSRGLRTDITYHYRPDLTVEWRRMIPSEFLYVAKEYETEVAQQFGKPLAEIDVYQVDDRKLRVYLGGWKKLLAIRGFTSLTNPCTFVTPEKAVATCTIQFTPNYETDMQPVTYSWTASASYANTSGDIAQLFLEATACNRAFSLCLRGFLNVNIVGKDEIGPSRRSKGADQASQPTTDQPTDAAPTTTIVAADTLHKRCAEKGLTFEQFKTAALNYKAELTGDPTKWTQYSDVEGPDAWTLLGKLKAAGEKAKPAKAAKG